MSDGFRYLWHGTAKQSGRYFAANWGAWRDLAGVCFRIAPGPCSQIEEKYWFSNDGFGLDDAGAIALADALDQAINTDALRYEDALSGQQDAEDRDFRLDMRLPDGRRLAGVAPDMFPDGKPWLITRLRDWSPFCETAVVSRSGSRRSSPRHH